MTEKEKFEEAKRLYKTANADQKYFLEILFPELQENEDEKIRKDLIKWINEFPDTIWRGHYKKDVIAWLEKQGETWIKTLDDANTQYQMSMNKEMTEEAVKLTIKGLEELHLWEIVKEHIEQNPTELLNGEDYGIDGLFHAIRILEKTLGKVDGYQTDDGVLSHEIAIDTLKAIYKKQNWRDDELLMIITWFSRIKQMATDMTTYNNHVMTTKECLHEISVLAKESIEYLNQKFEND